MERIANKAKFVLMVPTQNEITYILHPEQPKYGINVLKPKTQKAIFDDLQPFLMWMVCHPNIEGKFKIMVDLGPFDVIV